MFRYDSRSNSAEPESDVCFVVFDGLASCGLQISSRVRFFGQIFYINRQCMYNRVVEIDGACPNCFCEDVC